MSLHRLIVLIDRLAVRDDGVTVRYRPRLCELVGRLEVLDESLRRKAR